MRKTICQTKSIRQFPKLPYYPKGKELNRENLFVAGQSKQSVGSSTSVAGLMAAAAARQHQKQQQAAGGTMTREELERHLELKQSTKPQYMSLGQTMNTLPDDIFGNEDSNQGGSVFTAV